jgi:hypothetical protein
MGTRDAKTVLQIVSGARQVWHIVAMKESSRKVLGDLRKMLNGGAQGAQARFLSLHLSDESQIPPTDLRSRLLLVIGQNVSGLVHQRIGILEWRPEGYGALQALREELLQLF